MFRRTVGIALALTACMMMTSCASTRLSESKRKRLVDKDLKARRSYVRQEALLRLGATRDPSLVPAIAPHLEDAAPVCRCAAATALREIGATSASDALRKAVNVEEEEPLVRADMISAYAHVARQAAAPDLIRILNESRDPVVRRAAAEALGVTTSREAVPHLLEAMRARDDNVRVASWHSLEKITGKQGLPPETRKWLDALPDELVKPPEPTP